MRPRRDIYLDIIKTGLLTIRYAAHKGDAEWCHAEADHLHNLPGLLDVADEALHRYYWECERRGYLHAMGKKYEGQYDKFWNELAKASGVS